MIIQQMGLPTDTYAAYSLSVAGPVVTVTVAGVDVVASDLVGDAIYHAEVRKLADGSFALSDIGEYVGTVIIPARSYTENAAATDGSGSFVESAPTPIALDANSVVLQLWPLPVLATTGDQPDQV